MNNYPKRKNVGIVGFRGYSGIELVRLLSGHPGVDAVLLEHRVDGETSPMPRGTPAPRQAPSDPASVQSEGLELVFLATPPEVSLDLAPAMLDAGARVVDLSGAFRLKTTGNYQRWYNAAHSAPGLLASAAYGLPEFNRDQIRNADMVANPGCYPTAANLAIRPLIVAGLIDRTSGIVCDAKSGVSGAGRKASLKTSFCEVAENFSAYSLLDHRHVPEVLQNSGLEEAEFTFVAQLLPIDRGILETIYFRVNDGVTTENIIDTYEAAYAGGRFVRTYDPGVMPDLRAVQRTNFCDLGVRVDEPTRRAVVVSVIDNLGKGAAGQAVQNMNLMLGFAEHEGLL